MTVSIIDLRKPPVTTTVGLLGIGHTFTLGTELKEPELYMVIGVSPTRSHKECLRLGGSTDENGTTLSLPVRQVVDIVDIHIEIKRV